LVAIIACLDANPHHLITTARHRTIIQASVRLNLVPVVTRLNADSDHAITAALNRAVIAATVRIHTVSVIACLNSILNKPVPTRSR
jgi:plasmid stability protein